MNWFKSDILDSRLGLVVRSVSRSPRLWLDENTPLVLLPRHKCASRGRVSAGRPHHASRTIVLPLRCFCFSTDAELEGIRSSWKPVSSTSRPWCSGIPVGRSNMSARY